MKKEYISVDKSISFEILDAPIEKLITNSMAEIEIQGFGIPPHGSLILLQRFVILEPKISDPDLIPLTNQLSISKLRAMIIFFLPSVSSPWSESFSFRWSSGRVHRRCRRSCCRPYLVARWTWTSFHSWNIVSNPNQRQQPERKLMPMRNLEPEPTLEPMRRLKECWNYIFGARWLSCIQVRSK